MCAAIPASVAIRDYFAARLAARSPDKRDDFLGDLTAAGEAGTLSADELVCGIAFLIIAGHETTKNLIASGVLTLAEHADQLELLRGDPELLESAIEELLRFHSPLQKISRWTGAPVAFGEYDVPEGVLVTALIGAANRDPAAFAHAGQFDIRRARNRHLAFGRGLHVCLGTTLARLESRIALDALLRALPRIDVIDHRWRQISSFRALERLTLSLA
jgi:cytochrome P450